MAEVHPKVELEITAVVDQELCQIPVDIPLQIEQQCEQSNQSAQHLIKEIEQLKNERENDHKKCAAIHHEYDLMKVRISELQSLITTSDEQWQDKLSKIRNEFNNRLEKAEKERDSMVVKYAHSEKEVIVMQNARDSAEKKLKDLGKERDLLLEKIKGLNNEKARMCNILDGKMNELLTSQREIEKMKEEINSREIKVRWGQSKLKAECDNHKETQMKYEKTLQQIKQLKDELEEMKRQYNEVRTQSFGKISDEQLLEEKARFIIEKQNFEEQSVMYKNVQRDFEQLKTQHTQLVQEKEQLISKLQILEKERGEQEENIGRLKEQLSHQRQTLISVQTKLAEMDGVQMQLTRERERLSKNQEDLEQLKQTNLELEQEMERCRQKELELLNFTQKLTEQNVRLQSDFTSLKEKVEFLEKDGSVKEDKLRDLENKFKSCQMELNEEKDHRTHDGAVWAKTVTEKSRDCEDLQTQVRELQNELTSLRRKHAVNMKELTRELKATRKRLDQVESSSTNNTSTSGCHGNDLASLGSRTSSDTSINTAGMEHATPNGSPSPTGIPNHLITADWEKNALAEKMVRIQRENAKKSEKIDFLEEHVQHLMNELKKKNRIIQFHYIREDAGALVSEASDRNKAELAKHKGIMSSVYNSHTMDDGLNLELCLEINQKLQAVLEDTLLKNITLKDNLSTLGGEVARLTQQYQALLQQQQQH